MNNDYAREPVSEEQLEKYYLSWKEGLSSDAIMRAVGMGDHPLLFRRAQPEFLFYCKNKIRREFQDQTPANPVSHMKLSVGRRQEFLDLLSGGLSVEQAAEIMCVPLPTVYECWFKTDPLLKYEADNIRTLQNAKVVRAMYRKALGRRFIVRSRTKTKGMSEKGPINTTSVTETEKVIEGDFNAQKFWLINKMPEQFSDSGMKGDGGNMGAIMGAINQALEGHSDQDSLFDAEALEYSPPAVEEGEVF